MKSKGVLRYDDGNRLVVDIDFEIARYYRSTIPKHIDSNPQRYRPHITVVRGKYETPTIEGKWGKRSGEIVEFDYDHYLHIGRVYIWLAVHCKRLEEIREELGLSKCRDQYKGFHVTIANRKVR